MNYHPEPVFKLTLEFELNYQQESRVHTDFGSKHGAGFPTLHRARGIVDIVNGSLQLLRSVGEVQLKLGMS